MLNYIWISLVVIGILTAAGYDTKNELANSYRNGVPLETSFEVRHAPASIRSRSEVVLTIPAQAFNAFYGIEAVQQDVLHPATLYGDSAGFSTIVIAVTEASPAIWKEMAGGASTKDRLTGRVESLRKDSESKRNCPVHAGVHPIRPAQSRDKRGTRLCCDGSQHLAWPDRHHGSLARGHEGGRGGRVARRFFHVHWPR